MTTIGERNRNRSVSFRTEQLDASHGMAALCVVLNHYVQMVPETIRQAVSVSGLGNVEGWTSRWKWLRYTPLRLMISGQAAVMMFFVLSGFVLFASLHGRGGISWTSFLFRRFNRIYVPFAAVISAAALAYQSADPVPSTVSSDWLNGLLLTPGTYSFPAHLLMTGEPEGMTLNLAVWTLIHEMRVALFIPALFVLCQAAGAIEATAFLLASFDRVRADFPVGLGACLVVSLCLSSNLVTRTLNSRLPRWLGRISYSLYLGHLPILIVALGAGAPLIALPLVMTMILVVSALMYRFLEAPAPAPRWKRAQRHVD
ncbi:acyltransferase family protein [Pseudoroseomonas ludipueritiae]|uniref:Acyltransferase n=1 Tax=Pseudoroseomonas ludipueritiae TaxID=198093 RepID=A0ABR7R1P3_9PROT|nr:acyltransferase [Pseudoroseomonas ludipueritiae]